MSMFNGSKSSDEILKIIASKYKIQRGFLFILGLMLIAISFNLFLLPSQIVYGGVSGLSIVINDWLDIDPALFIFWASTFLLGCSALLLGKSTTVNSILGSFLFPVFIKLTENIGDYVILQETNILLMAIFGGLLNGFGLGIVFKHGFTTGGTDILNQIIYKYFKISIGKALFIVDITIVLIGSLVFGPEILMYGAIVIYIMSIVTDKVILGISGSKAFYIITSKQEEVKSFILNSITRGVTIMDAHGGYSGKNMKVLMCVIPTKDYFKVKEGIFELDKDAFFVVTDSYEVHNGEHERKNL